MMNRAIPSLYGVMPGSSHFGLPVDSVIAAPEPQSITEPLLTAIRKSLEGFPSHFREGSIMDAAVRRIGSSPA